MRPVCYLLVAGYLVLGMIGCGPRASDADDAQVPTVRLSMDEAPLADTVAGRLFRNPSYVTLRGRMLGSISQLLDWRDRYVIFDRKQNYVYLFDTTGQFIRQVGQVGKGPREYVRLSGVALAGDTLVLYADQPNKLMYYDRVGDFLGERPIARRYCFLEGIGYGGADDRVYGVMPANRGGFGIYGHPADGRRDGRGGFPSVRGVAGGGDGGGDSDGGGQRCAVDQPAVRQPGLSRRPDERGTACDLSARLRGGEHAGGIYGGTG